MSKTVLSTSYDSTNNRFEIGIDEAGRGPLFGRLYVAAVVLPKEGYRHEDMKDSKKFSSKTKIQKVAEYIKTDALAWSIKYVEASVIDEINIRQSVFRGMHECIRDILSKLSAIETGSEPKEPIYQNDYMLLIDGNDFKPFTQYNETTEEITSLPFETIEGGDNKFTAIAAASILAKVEHDKYISDLCAEYPYLITNYALDRNMGYGTKLHIEGIKEHGITEWHRKTFAPCKLSGASIKQPLP